MAKLERTVNNRDAVQAIAEMADFTNSTGSLRGVCISNVAYERGGHFAGTGIMRNPAEIEQLVKASEAGRLEYVVYSYSTPIAWVIDGTWVRTAERYSVTTSKHTGLCPTTEVMA